MKITVLTYLDSENENSKEYDAVVPQVARTLRRLGHRVSILGVHGDVKRLIAGLSRRKPELVFNLMEMFGDNVFGDIPVTGLLELLGVRYTGSGPGELYLSQDKGLTKKLLAFEDILYPRYAVFSRQAAFETGGNLRMPLFVKPLRSDASLGIGGKSLVHDAVALMERVAAIHKELDDSALAEEYIDGREFYVGVLGNSPAQGAAAGRGGLHRLSRGRAQGDGQQGQVGRAQQGVQGDQVGDGQPSRRAPGQAAEGGGRRLPRAPREGLRPRGPPAHRDRRDLRARGERELLSREVERVRHGGRRERARLSAADREDREPGVGTDGEEEAVARRHPSLRSG